MSFILSPSLISEIGLGSSMDGYGIFLWCLLVEDIRSHVTRSLSHELHRSVYWTEHQYFHVGYRSDLNKLCLQMDIA